MARNANWPARFTASGPASALVVLWPRFKRDATRRLRGWRLIGVDAPLPDESPGDGRSTLPPRTTRPGAREAVFVNCTSRNKNEDSGDRRGSRTIRPLQPPAHLRSGDARKSSSPSMASHPGHRPAIGLYRVSPTSAAGLPTSSPTPGTAPRLLEGAVKHHDRDQLQQRFLSRVFRSLSPPMLVGRH